MSPLEEHLANAGINDLSPSLLSDSTSRPIYRVNIPGGDAAFAMWARMRSALSPAVYSAVLLGTTNELANRDFSDLPSDERVRKTVALADSLHFPEWFGTRHQERLDEFLEYNEGEDPSGFFAEAGTWRKDVRPSQRLSTPFDIVSKKPVPELSVALVPTTVTWEIPAYLDFGAWNECPEPAVHCAAFRYWNIQHGAEIVAITGDVVEAVVRRPPPTREDAMRLAEQQYEYCEDIVSQGTDAISRLAASLLNGEFWFFWWD